MPAPLADVFGDTETAPALRMVVVAADLVESAETPDPFIAIEDTHHDPVPFNEDAIAKVLADEARGRAYFPGYRVRQEQIDLAASAPAVDHSLGLGGDHLRVPAHQLVAQRLVAQGLSSLFGRRIEHDAPAEDGRHEGIGCRLIELLVAAAEEGLLGLLAHHHHDAIPCEVELADLA